MQKGQALIFLLIGILVFIVAAGAFYLGKHSSSQSSLTPTYQTPQPTSSNSPDETANWKTYTTISDGFSFKYPESFTPLEKNPPGTLIDPTRQFIFGNDINKDNISATEWIYKNRCPDKKLCSELTPGIIEDSYQFYDYTHYQSLNTVFKHGDKIFEFSMNATNPDTPISDEAKSIYKKILSTFKFLKVSSDNQFSINSIKVGDVIAGMTVKSIGPLELRVSSLSEKNYKVVFSGRATVSGQYNIDDGNGPGISSKVVYFMPDEANRDKLPREVSALNKSAGFVFNDYDNAYKLLSPYGKSGHIKVIIDSLTLVALPAEVSNTADLILVTQ